MPFKLTALERAFELAKSGNCATVEEIKVALRAEGFSTEQIIGHSLVRQLRSMMAVARPHIRDERLT